MKEPITKLENVTQTYIEEKGVARSIACFRTFLESYMFNLSREHGIPTRGDREWHPEVMKLEENPETWQAAQEIWNTSWLLDEVRNIESSIDQIRTCILEKQKLEREKLV